MMRQGGNGQIKTFFRRAEVVVSSAIHLLYNSPAAAHYRKKLEERVDKILTGEVRSHVRIFRRIRSSSTDSAKSIEELSRITSSSIYSVSFGLGPLGMTLTKDFNNEAVVSKVASGSAAERSGVVVGDYVKGIAGIFSDKYDEIMAMIARSSRPFTIMLLRCSSHDSDGFRSTKSSPGMKLKVISSGEDGLNSLEDSIGGLCERVDSLELSSSESDVDNREDHGISNRNSDESNGKRHGVEDWVEEDSGLAFGRGANRGPVESLILDDCRQISPFKLTRTPRVGLTLTVMFDVQPMGFTLGADSEGRPEVVRLREGGRAMQLGVNVKDILIAVNGDTAGSYQEAMQCLTGTKVPVRLAFYRPNVRILRDDHHSVQNSDDTNRWWFRKNASFSQIEDVTSGNNSYHTRTSPSSTEVVDRS